ncbi:hypothetical protein FNF29_00868 [Cafeteria roenbergensis]|uniref:Uncharacterized protein n=1 Tax=Cafeteria roenbergensis TaxID=33653 RepID=A0A5A8CWH4_CAFRO|nr:hypothetical protein FNF29_00868 [Cafeteria roenbergensis]|eukprot:KAA0156757.1 hypothetical protein FNF29_00868 [Cafeteria roenbergensis]
MGAAQSASQPASPYAWIRTPLTVVLMLMSQSMNWQSPALLMAVRGAFISMVGALLFFFYQIKGDVEARFEADQEYRERKVWIRRQKPKSWMSSLFGDDQGPQRPKADEYVETTEGTLEREGANKAFQATLSSAMMPMGASFFFGVHFMLLIQVLNVPFTMLEDRMLKRHLWPSLLGSPEDELPPVETLVAEPSGILFADPSVVPPTLQLLRRKARAKRAAEGKDPAVVPADGADPQLGLGGRRPVRTQARLTAAAHGAGGGGIKAAGAGSSGEDQVAASAAGADDDDLDIDEVSYGEGYDELMEDAIFGAWEDDEAVNTRAIEALGEQKKPLAYATDEQGWTFLMVASGSRATPQRAVERMLELGCGPADAEDADGWSALHWAAMHDCPQAVRAIARWELGRVLPVQEGSPARLLGMLERRNKDGKTPLDLADDEGSELAAAALREAAAACAGAKPVARGKKSKGMPARTTEPEPASSASAAGAAAAGDKGAGKRRGGARDEVTAAADELD